MDWGISMRGRFGLEGPSFRASATSDIDEEEEGGEGCGQGGTIPLSASTSSQEVDEGWSEPLDGHLGVAEESMSIDSQDEDGSEDEEVSWT